MSLAAPIDRSLLTEAHPSEPTLTFLFRLECTVDPPTKIDALGSQGWQRNVVPITSARLVNDAERGEKGSKYIYVKRREGTHPPSRPIVPSHLSAAPKC